MLDDGDRVRIACGARHDFKQSSASSQLSSQFLVLYQFACKLHAEVACRAIGTPGIPALFSGHVAKAFRTVAGMNLAV